MNIYHLFQTDHEANMEEYDVNRAFIIIAADEMDARELAARQAKDEGELCWLDPYR